MDPLEIIDYLEQSVNHLEHGGADPSGFWPHHCEDCCYFEDNDCALGCIHYRDLKLVDYVALRVKEKSDA